MIRYHAPPTRVLAVPDLLMDYRSTEVDYYYGPADAVVASGLASMCQLPGRPGMPGGCVCYRPAGRERAGCWRREHGYMKIVLRPTGDFRVMLNVNEEERHRRWAACLLWRAGFQERVSYPASDIRSHADGSVLCHMFAELTTSCRDRARRELWDSAFVAELQISAADHLSMIALLDGVEAEMCMRRLIGFEIGGAPN